MSVISIHHAKSEKEVHNGWQLSQSVNFDVLAETITKYVWSPCVWKGGERKQANFEVAHVVALDFDAGLTLVDACNRLCDMQHIIATTKSHQKIKDKKPACDRFRVILRLQRPIVSIDEYRATISYLINFYDADAACKDAARFFFPCVDLVSVNDYRDDFCVDPISPQRVAERQAAHIERLLEFRGSGRLPKRVEGFLKYGAPPGRRNVTVYGIAADMWICGVTKEDIVEIIMKSPIGLDLDEVARTVGNAVRRAEEELVGYEKGTVYV